MFTENLFLFSAANRLKLFALVLLLAMLKQEQGWAQSALCSGGFGRAIQNVDFGSGAPTYNTANLGFTTNFKYWNRPRTNDGYYSIVNQIPNDFQLGGVNVWVSGYDHTSGDGRGYMMLVNADASLSEFYRAQVDDLCVGGTYEFSSYLANIFKPSSAFATPVTSIPPRVRFDILDTNGNTLHSINTGNLPTTPTLTWLQYGLTFKATASSIVLVMISEASSGQGNDIVLDDITFRPCIPVTTSINPTQTICEKGNATFSVNVSGNSNYQYARWQISRNGGTNWTYMGSEIVQNPPSSNYDVPLALSNVPVTDDNTRYRLVLATSSINLANPTSSCNVLSDTSLLRVNAYPILKITNPDTTCNTSLDLTATAVTAGSTLNNGVLSYYTSLSNANAGTNPLSLAQAKAVSTSGQYFIRAATATTPVCADVEPVTVFFDQPKVISLSAPSPLCKDNAGFTLTANVTNVNNLLWTKSNSTIPLQSSTATTLTVAPTAADLALDSIWIKVTSNDGKNACPAIKDSVKVKFYNPPTIVLPKDTTFCENTPSLNLQVTATVTNSPTSVTWQTSPTLVSPSPATGTSTSLNLANQSTSFTLTATASTTGCLPRSDKMEIVFVPVPVADAGVDATICTGDEFVRSVPLNPAYRYKWKIYESGVARDSALSPQIRYFPSKDATLELTISSGAGCTDSDDMLLGIITPPTIVLPTHECLVPSLALNPVVGASPAIGTFSWSRNGNVLGTSATPSALSISQNGNYRFSYKNGACFSSDSTLVTSSPTISVADKTACIGTSVTLSATSIKKASYAWNGGTAGTLPTYALTTTSLPQTISLQVVDSLGCKSTASAIVKGVPNPEFSLAVTPVCTGETGKIAASLLDPSIENANTLQFQWQKAQTSLSASTWKTIDITEPGTYTLRLNIGECIVSKSVSAIMFPAPVIQTQEKYVFCNEDPSSTVVLQSNFDGAKQSWYSKGKLLGSDKHLTVHPDSNTTYVLAVENAQGCKASVPILVEICCAPRLFVPNVITPSSQDINAQLKIFGKYFSQFELTVFSRWGEVVYSTKNPDLAWDGNYKSESMPIGVYPWIVTYEGTCPDFKGPYKKIGEVTVVR